MIAALIFVISVAALFQFFVSYCRSLIAATHKVPLSEHARDASGIGNREITGDEFARLVQLVRLCPETGQDVSELRAVRAYFGILNLVRGISRPVAPAVATWVDAERQGCAYFAAVALDRRIARSRELMAEQIANR